MDVALASACGWLNSQQERLRPWPINRRFTSFLETAFTLPTQRSSLQGQPQFNYHDAFQAKNFTGNQIQTADTVLGRLVTVFLIQTIDSGSTTFTLLVPTANLPLSKVANITTEALRPCTNSRSSNRRRRQTELYPAVGLPWERSSRCRAPRS